MTLTRIFSLCLLCCAIAFGSFAQRYNKVSIRNARLPKDMERYHQLHIGIGGPSSVAAREDNFYTKSLVGTRAGEPWLPPLQLGYTYGVNKRLQFLAHASYEALDYRAERGNLSSRLDHSRSFVSLAIGANYRWLLRSSVAVYSGFLVGGGGSFYHAMEADPALDFNREQYFYPTAQLTLVGVSWGKRLGGFAELGLGTRGIVFGGIYYRFYTY